MSNGQMVELTCPSGHKSHHMLARLLSHNNAWCARCGADLRLDPAEAKALADGKAADEPDAEKRGNLAKRRVGVETA